MTDITHVCTLITTPSFFPGLLTLMYSLRPHLPSTIQCIIFYTPTTVQTPTLVSLVELLNAGNTENPNHYVLKPLDELAAPNNPNNWCYTKLRIFSPDHYAFSSSPSLSTTTVLYLDSDTLLLSSPFPYLSSLPPSPFRAAPDVFPPGNFNAGVLLFQPSSLLHDAAISAVPITPSYDGGDTGLLNSLLPHWLLSSDNKLPFALNAQRLALHMTSRKYWDAVGEKVVLHFSSRPKPWEVKPAGELEVKFWGVWAGERS